jgi:multiple sugar transport system substrate-binding protein
MLTKEIQGGIEMNKRFKFITAMVMTALMTSALAGCAKKEAATAPAAAADKEVTIKFAVWDYSKAPEYKEIIDAFQADNPKIKVEAVELASADYGDKMSVMLAGGDTTDVFAVKDMPGYSSFAKKNQILSLDEFIAKDKVDLKAYNGITDSIKMDGKLYALPFRSDFWVLYYNKDLFDKAGVAYPTNDMTWDQYRDIAKKLTSGSGANQVFGTYAHTWKSAVINWAVADGKGTLTDGKYEFLKPAYEMFLPMQNDDKSMMSLANAKAASAHYSGQFETAKAAMLPMGTWFVGTLRSDKLAGKHNVNWGIATIPHFKGSKPGTTFGNVTPVAINAASKNKDAAWKFVKFMGSEKAATILAKRGVMPAFRNDAVMNAYNSLDGIPKGAQEALKTSNVALEFPPHANGGAIDKILQEEHELIMIGKNSVDAGIAAMNKRVQEVLNSK